MTWLRHKKLVRKIEFIMFLKNLIGNGFDDKAVEVLAEAIKVSC